MAEFTDIGSGSFGFSNTFGPLSITLTNPPGAILFPTGSITNVTNVTVQNVTFILRGWYPTTGQYEVWTGLSRNTPPPSGHTLSDVTVIGELPVNSLY